MAARWEFRVFGDDLGPQREALDRLGDAGDEDARADVYFLVPGRTDASLKLREDTLDLKLLREERDGLEQWEPAGEAAFPVESETLRELLGPAGVRLDLPAGPVALDALLEVVRAARGVRLVPVAKRRRHYALRQVSAEFTRLLMDGLAVESIAVEGADPGRTAGAIAALGLASRRNTSYQRFLVEAALAPDRGGAERPMSGR